MPETTRTVVDAPDQHRFELWLDGADHPAGIAEYRLEDGTYVFFHTEVEDGHEGEGLGSVLAQGALDAVRGRGATLVPQCPFIARWIERHPDYGDLVRR